MYYIQFTSIFRWHFLAFFFSSSFFLLCYRIITKSKQEIKMYESNKIFHMTMSENCTICGKIIYLPTAISLSHRAVLIKRNTTNMRYTIYIHSSENRNKNNNNNITNNHSSKQNIKRHRRIHYAPYLHMPN